MKNDGVFTDRRLLQAIDLIDPKFIAEVFDDLKVPDTSKGYVSDKRGLHRAYRQFIALAACLILLSAAFPIAHYVLVNYDFQAGGWGSGTTEEISDQHTLAETETEPEDTIESSETTREITSVPTITPPEPDYLLFIPELEPITLDEMLAVNEAWNVAEYNRVYESRYQYYIKKLSEEEAARLADEEATKYTKEYSYCFFNYWRFQLYGYLGKFSEYIILVDLDRDSIDDEDMIIGKHNIGDHRLYAYRDGEIYSLKDIYDNAYFSDEQLDIIADRLEKYNIASLHFSPTDYQKTNVTE